MEDSVTSELLDDTAVSEEPLSHSAENGTHLTPQELVAKAIAPVKREFLRPPPVRSSSNNVKDAASTAKNDGDDKAAPSSLVKEKKSKRQLKRERRQVNLSFISLCVLVVFVNLRHFNMPCGISLSETVLN